MAQARDNRYTDSERRVLDNMLNTRIRQNIHVRKELLKKLNPSTLLYYMNCIYEGTKEEIQQEQRNSGKINAVAKFLDEAPKYNGWGIQFLDALYETEHQDLIDRLAPNPGYRPPVDDHHNCDFPRGGGGSQGDRRTSSHPGNGPGPSNTKVIIPTNIRSYVKVGYVFSPEDKPPSYEEVSASTLPKYVDHKGRYLLERDQTNEFRYYNPDPRQVVHQEQLMHDSSANNCDVVERDQAHKLKYYNRTERQDTDDQQHTNDSEANSYNPASVNESSLVKATSTAQFHPLSSSRFTSGGSSSSRITSGGSFFSYTTTTDDSMEKKNLTSEQASTSCSDGISSSEDDDDFEKSDPDSVDEVLRRTPVNVLSTSTNHSNPSFSVSRLNVDGNEEITKSYNVSHQSSGTLAEDVKNYSDQTGPSVLKDFGFNDPASSHSIDEWFVTASMASFPTVREESPSDGSELTTDDIRISAPTLEHSNSGILISDKLIPAKDANPQKIPVVSETQEDSARLPFQSSDSSVDESRTSQVCNNKSPNNSKNIISNPLQSNLVGNGVMQTSTSGCVGGRDDNNDITEQPSSSSECNANIDTSIQSLNSCHPDGANQKTAHDPEKDKSRTSSDRQSDCENSTAAANSSGQSRAVSLPARNIERPPSLIHKALPYVTPVLDVYKKLNSYTEGFS